MQHLKTMLACMAATLLFSCSKKEEEKTKTPITPSTDKIVGTWKTIAIKADRPVYHWNTTELVTDLWDREQDCHKDDLMIFKADGTYISDEGPSKCLSASPQIKDQGKWRWSGSNIIGTSDGIDYPITIEQVDDTRLVMTVKRFYIIGTDTTAFYATLTYNRQ